MSLLPVKLLYFRGAQSIEGVKLQWDVTEVIKVNKFEIERSNDGQLFSSIAITLTIDEAQPKYNTRQLAVELRNTKYEVRSCVMAV